MQYWQAEVWTFADLGGTGSSARPKKRAISASRSDWVAASAAPYGYTITIWSAGTVSAGTLGTPHLGQVLLFMIGAVLGFFALKGAAFGTVGAVTREPAHPLLPLWEFAHVLAAGGAIVAPWAADHSIGGDVAWPVAGFLATSVFFVLTVAQTVLAARTRAAGARR